MDAGRRITTGTRPVHRAATTLAIACALVGAGILALPLSAGASGGKGHRLILTPRAGKGLPAKPVKIRVHARNDVHRFRVKLNGHRIGRYFSNPSHGVRRLEASLSYGLRHGPNLLHVRAGGRSQSMRFRVWRHKPLVGAGLDQHVAPGAKVYLKGRRSKTHIARAALAAGSDSGFSWSTSDLPPGAPPTAPGPGKEGTATFVPPVPGRYTLKVSVTGPKGRTSFDQMTVNAYPPPAIPIDTIVLQGSEYGIQVGEHFYPDRRGTWVHLVALDRKTGRPVDGPLGDKSYDCPPAQFGTPDYARCGAQLTQDLNSLGDKAIAIVSSVRTQGATYGPYGIEKALLDARMIPHLTAYSGADDLVPSTISAVGVPGQPKEGQWHTVLNPGFTPGVGPGRMQDYLFLDNQGNYGFAPSDRLPFDTAAPGTTPSTNVIQVGQQNYSQSFDGGIRDGGGFQVLVLDPVTLKPETPGGQSQWFETDHSSQTALIDQLESMRALIHRANQDPAHPVIVISSLGQPVTRTSSDTINQKLSQLVDEVEQAGGTRNGFYGMLDPGLYDHDAYTLVSRGGMGPGLGEQLVAGGISGNGTGPLNTAPLTGALSRTGDDYSFDVAHSQADVLAGTTPSKGVADLTQVLFQRPTDWPEGDDQGKVNAIAWIGHQMKPKTDDLRAQYWTHALVDDHFDSTFWDGTSNSIVPQIDRLSYPGGQPGFTANDLSWAKGELTQEIAWLIDTHRYLGELATPLDQLQKDSWSKFKGIASDVKNKVKTGDDDQTKVTVGAFFDVSRKFFELAPGAGEAFHAANIIFEAALALEGVGDQSGDDDFRAHANQIAVEFTDRLDKAEHLLQVELPGTISVDYGKLSTIGGCLEGATTCPFDPKDWNYTGPDQDRARPVFATASEVWAYSALLPARYNAYKLPPWWKTNASGEDGYCGITLGLDAVHCPFENQPASAQVAKPIYRNIPTYSHNVTRPGGGGDPVSTGDTWQITALGYLTGSGTLFDPWEMHHPDAGVTDHVFNPPANGGLGLDPETFFDQNFTPQTLDHYPHKETRVHWCANIQDDNCPG